MKKVYYVLLLSLCFLLYSSTKIYAGVTTIYLPQGSTPALQGYSPTNESNCSSIAKPSDFCSNSSPVGTTTCSGEVSCVGGNTWAKYGLLGCYAKNNSLGDYAWLYSYDTIVCSIGDKYNSSNPPVMDAGLCTGSAVTGSCNVGGSYKTCCSGSTLVNARSFQDDPFAPNEADCGTATTVRCGGAGEPACGQAACNTLGTGPTSTPAPTATPGGPTATPPPPTPTPPSGGGACGELISGQLNQPTTGSTVTSPVRFQGQYWDQTGKCGGFQVNNNLSHIRIDNITEIAFSTSEISGGFFDKSVSISSGSRNVLVHVEGWCPNEQRNGVVELPIIGGGCGSATITVPTKF